MNLILLFDSDFIDAEQTRVRLAGRRREHALSVCKVVAGDELRVGLLNGQMGTAKVETISDAFLEMSVVLKVTPPPPLPLTLILALPRPKALKRCIETVAAMGVKTLYIIGSQRVDKSYWSTPELSNDNLRAHLLLGLEQARDTVLPHIEIRRLFKPFVEDEASAIIAGSRALVAHPYATAACPHDVHGRVTLAIGPEGGFVPYEIELLKKYGFNEVSIGARILRVEQAIPAILGRLLL